MRIDVISVLPEMLDGFVNNSIVKRAQEKNVVEIYLHSLREYGKKNYRQVDDYAFGGGAGMVMMIEPIYELIEKLKSERKYDEIIYMSPDGECLKQKETNRLSILNNIIILCGHYKGVDHRIREHLITKEISIGDYVISGGELAAAVLIDAITRIIPNAIGDEESALTDSFQDDLLSPPVYTRPPEFNGWKVPDILLSGDHKKIEQWKEEQAYERTKRLRPDLLKENYIL
ncbi:MAG: tRNA (guanosine(37)-N1)-methyltransferase TrmD [Prevotellaceae bacterium]|jgi:tRNA (guanine37-N1)-methyltransferase|nr:tRNA (guanosine(37)-N1)-methyltransferase TrmD [Prevotellaceae bacterium]